MSFVTIASQDIADWHGPETPAFARLIANQEFVTSENVIVNPGDGFYQQFTCSVVSNKIRIASGSAYSTTDSDTPWGTYTLAIYSAKGGLLTTIAGNLRIPNAPSSTTWTALIEYSQARVQPYRFAFYDTNQINVLLNNYYTQAQADSTFQKNIRVINAVQGGALPTNIGANQSGAIFTLDGSTPSLTMNLPAAAAGLFYSFYCLTNNLVQINAQAGNTIRIGTSVTASGGNTTTSTRGAALTLAAINTTEWIAISNVLNWTLT